MTRPNHTSLAGLSILSQPRRTNLGTYQHCNEALWSSPDVHQLCQWQLDHARDEGSHDIGRGEQRMLSEGTRDICCERAGDLLLERIDEKDQKDPIKSSAFVRVAML